MKLIDWIELNGENKMSKRGITSFNEFSSHI